MRKGLHSRRPMPGCCSAEDLEDRPVFNACLSVSRHALLRMLPLVGEKPALDFSAYTGAYSTKVKTTASWQTIFFHPFGAASVAKQVILPRAMQSI